MPEVNVQVEQDSYDLDWWREVFACRFLSENLPKPGTPLHGYRFQLRVQDPAGEWVKWRNDGRP